MIHYCKICGKDCDSLMCDGMCAKCMHTEMERGVRASTKNQTAFCIHNVSLTAVCRICEHENPGHRETLVFGKNPLILKYEADKNDSDKQPWDLFPFDAADEIVSVLKEGAKKYAPRNWELGMNWSRCYAACMRHLWKWWQGEDKDPEWGLSHLAHAGCCILFLLAYERRKKGNDDRPK